MTTPLVVSGGYISWQPIGDSLVLHGDVNVDTYQIVASADLILAPTGALRSAGGDPCGIATVDLQASRSSSDQIASGDYSEILGGSNNKVTGEASCVGGGFNNLVTGAFTVIIGGMDGVATGTYNFLGGGQANHIDGDYNTLCGGEQCTIHAVTYSFVGGGYTTDCKSSYGVMFTGLYSDIGATADYSVVFGGYACSVNVWGGAQSGAYSFVGSGYIIRVMNAEYTTIFGGRSGSTQKGYQSHGTAIGGQYSDCTGSHVFIGSGIWNDANGTHSVSMCGRFMDSEGAYAVSLNGRDSYAPADYSIMVGKSTSANYYGEFSQSSGTLSVGVPIGTLRGFQRSTLLARNQTSDASETVLYLDGVSEVLTLPVFSTLAFNIYITGRSTGESAAYQIKGVIRRAGIAFQPVLVGTLKTILAEDDATWDANVRANIVDGTLEIYVTGVAGKSINWVAKVELTMAIPVMRRNLIIKL